MIRRLAVATSALLVLAGCSDDGGGSSSPAPSSSSPAASPAAQDRYVALGDSFTAAPGVPPQVDLACGRSGRNYPNVLADELGLDLTDVSCSSATSQDLLRDQLAAVTPDTDLVTVSIGGNDQGLFGLLVSTCSSVVVRVPADAAPCRESAADTVAPTLRIIEDNVTAALEAVTEAAPEARVVVVSYPRLLPRRGTCFDRAPFSGGDYAFIGEVNEGLVEAQRAAAEATGVEFADVFAASDGHDICARRPWVNGAATAPDGTILYHPFARGEAGMAAVVAELLQD